MKRLVIIGGGFAGSHIAKKLERRFNTILIDTKDYFEYTPSILRTIVDPGHMLKIQSLHFDYLKKAKVIIDKVIGITESKVMTKNNEFHYDYLAICAGSDYEEPIKSENLVRTYRAEELISNHQKLKDSKNIVIIGGGLVGVELAAEIADKYDDKEITIIQSGDRLISRNKEKTISYVTKHLTKKKIKFLFGEKVVERKEDHCTTDKGTKIKQDLTFLCVGIKPNTGFMDKKLLKGNSIKVDNHMRVKGNIFSAGDITSIKEEKTAQAANHQANIVIKNIIALDKNKPLTEYVPKRKPMIISLGKSNGVLEYNNLVLTGIIPSLLKSFVEKKEMKKRR